MASRGAPRRVDTTFRATLVTYLLEEAEQLLHRVDSEGRRDLSVAETAIWEQYQRDLEMLYPRGD